MVYPQTARSKIGPFRGALAHPPAAGQLRARLLVWRTVRFAAFNDPADETVLTARPGCPLRAPPVQTRTVSDILRLSAGGRARKALLLFGNRTPACAAVPGEKQIGNQ